MRTSKDPSNGKHELTTKQILYMNARLAGKSKLEAVKEAGYSEGTAPYHIERNANLREVLLACLEKQGLHSDFIAKKIKKGLEAKKTIYATSDGTISDMKQVPDHETQHKYVRDLLEIRGDVKQSTVENLNIGLISVPQAVNEDQWNDASTVDMKPDLPSETSDSKNEGI